MTRCSHTHTYPPVDLQSFVETAFYSIDIFIAYRIFWGSSWCWPSHWHDIKNGLLSDGTVNLIPGVPAYHAPREMRAYYVIEFGFYFSQLLSLVSKKHKKDFWQMFVHHLLTSALIAFSYAIGFLRIGTRPSFRRLMVHVLLSLPLPYS